ncbi:hypothetical protein Tco_0607273, partial [Tanacetum coccineum]
GSGHGNRILRDTSTIEKSPLDFANENPSQQNADGDGAEAQVPHKVLRRDHAAARPGQSTRRGKSLASIGLEAGTTFVTPATQEALL